MTSTAQNFPAHWCRDLRSAVNKRVQKIAPSHGEAHEVVHAEFCRFLESEQHTTGCSQAHMQALCASVKFEDLFNRRRQVALASPSLAA